jgi:hypothetical protein
MEYIKGNKMKTFEFTGMAGGNGECFCFFVDKETYIKICGDESYKFELEHLKSWHEEITKAHVSDGISQPEPFVEPIEWPIYPNEFFKSGNLLKIKIDVEELPIESI